MPVIPSLCEKWKGNLLLLLVFSIHSIAVSLSFSPLGKCPNVSGCKVTFVTLLLPRIHVAVSASGLTDTRLIFFLQLKSTRCLLIGHAKRECPINLYFWARPRSITGDRSLLKFYVTSLLLCSFSYSKREIPVE